MTQDSGNSELAHARRLGSLTEPGTCLFYEARRCK